MGPCVEGITEEGEETVKEAADEEEEQDDELAEEAARWFNDVIFGM